LKPSQGSLRSEAAKPKPQNPSQPKGTPMKPTAALTALQVGAEHKLVAPEKAQTLIDAWIMATLARNAIVLVRGKRVDQLPQPGPQLAQVAGAAGWNPEDSQEFLGHYLRVTRRARKVVDEVFWGEVISEHDDY